MVYLQTPSHMIIMHGLIMGTTLNTERLRFDRVKYTDIDWAKSKEITEEEFERKRSDVIENLNEINRKFYE